MRKLISDFFVGNPKIEVVGTARNGKDAIKKIQQLKPNVVTMDVEMPEMNGLDALRQIMEICPVPVVMLSSTTQGGAENTLTAMESGAVDFVRPVFTPQKPHERVQIFPKIINVAVPSPQHSPILGQLPDVQMVFNLYLSTKPLSSVYFFPVGSHK